MVKIVLPEFVRNVVKAVDIMWITSVDFRKENANANK